MVNILNPMPVDSYCDKSNNYARLMKNKATKSINTRNWTDSIDITNSHFVGKLGECHFAYIVSLGIPSFPEPNYTVGFYGDKGIDFYYNNLKIDVKTCINKQSVNRQEYLKIQIDKMIADIYSLVVYYPASKQCRYVGSVTASYVKQIAESDSRCHINQRDNIMYYWIHEQLVTDNTNKNIYNMLRNNI